MNTWHIFLAVAGLHVLMYTLVYTVRMAWMQSTHNTKKLCDLCFRDIKAWNDHARQYELNKQFEDFKKDE